MSKARLLAIAVVAGLATGGLLLYRVLCPAHAKVVLEDPALALAYPSAWKTSGFVEEQGLRILGIRPQGGPPFDTRWDSEDVLLRVVEFPPGKAAAPEKRLLQLAADARVDNPRGIPAFPRIKTLALADGVKALALTLPSEHEVLDVGLPKERFWSSLYASLLVRDPAWTYVVFEGKGGKSYEVAYLLPGDRLARLRYRFVFGSILKSLRLK